MIHVTYHRQYNRVTIKGHAGSGPEGHDLVCAAVSAIALTLAGNIRYMEAQEAVETLTMALDGDFRYKDSRSHLFGSCVVEFGSYRGQYAADNGAERLLHPAVTFGVGSANEAGRFAKGLLRDANADGMTGWVRTDKIMSGYAAGSVVNIRNKRAPSWDGPVFLYRVRHDYAAGTSKLFFRKAPEGFA